MRNHYHPPRVKSALRISDERIKYIASRIVNRAFQKISHCAVKANSDELPAEQKDEDTPLNMSLYQQDRPTLEKGGPPGYWPKE